MKLKKTNLKNINEKLKEKKPKIPLFSIIDKGFDVKINRPIGGKWEGFTFSQLRDDYEGQLLLKWICNKDFDSDIIEIAEEILKTV